MTNKILVTVVVPMIEEKYDIYIPISKPIKIAKELIVDTIHQLSGQHFPQKKKCLLMSTTGVVFNDSQNIKECGIKNGDKIILI